jgi:PAS domain S-box-containing protein
LRHRDGHLIPVMTGAASFEGTHQQGVAFVLDLSEAKRVEDALREREARIRRLVDANIIGVVFWNTSGRISEVNDEFLRVVGYSREELLSGKVGWTDLSTPQSRAGRRAGMQPGSAFPPYQKDFIRKDGSLVPVMVCAALFEGSADQGVAFVLDLTEQKRVEDALRKVHEELEARVEERTRELRESNQRLAQEVTERQHAEAVLAERSRELARSNAELEQFAYIASHDLQEPLRMVGSYMQLLQRRYQERLDAPAQEFIGYAADGAKRMQGLIDDLLTYSRVGSSSKPFRPIDVNLVVKRSLDGLAMAIQDSGAQVTVDRLPEVTADASQLGQLFQNLVANAIKFHGDAAPRIHIAVAADGECWRFSVRDNGIGIAAEYAERIFVMFQRLHTRHEYPGTGIGLAVCKKIVERHGGRIWVEAAAEGGSIFQFTLPALPRQAQGGS